MEYARLGKTDLMVSRVGMGGIPLTRPEDDDAVNLIHHALERGINWIDTSIAYGPSERRIGKAIEGRRDKVIVATKGTGDKNSVLKCIEASLKRLRTDYIDLWQFHGVNTFETYEGLHGTNGGLEGAREALAAGKIRHIGMSSHALDVAVKAAASGLFETIQFPFNIVSNDAAKELIPLAVKNDLGFIAMKPFAGGRVRKANLAIKYLLQFEGVFPDPGVEKIIEVDQITEIAGSRDWRLTPEELQEIEEIRARVGTRFCRQCEYCMPCEQGVHIVSLMYLPILYDVWPREWFLNWGYVKQGVESADNCIECGECEEKCPYQLPIREMIAEHLTFYESVRSQ